jgi:hypothetical protein
VPILRAYPSFYSVLFVLVFPFLIVGGLYSVTALRKTTRRVTVYTKHRLTLQKP